MVQHRTMHMYVYRTNTVSSLSKRKRRWYTTHPALPAPADRLNGIRLKVSIKKASRLRIRKRKEIEKEDEARRIQMQGSPSSFERGEPEPPARAFDCYYANNSFEFHGLPSKGLGRTRLTFLRIQRLIDH